MSATYVLTLDPNGSEVFGQPFTAPSLAAAEGVAQSAATLFNRTVYLANGPGTMAGNAASAGPPLTAYTPNATYQGETGTSIGGGYTPFPSGIAF